MKLFLAFVLSFSALVAQTVDSSPRKQAVYIVGTLPTASSWTNETALVTDGAYPGDCKVGSGSTRVLCVSDGTVWAAVAGGRRVCDIAIGDETASAITNSQLGPQKRICYIPAASTILEIDVSADAGTPNIIVGKNTAGTVLNSLSAALATAASGGIACSNTGGTTGIDSVTTCSATLQNTALAAGSYLELVSGTAGGTAKLMTIHVIYTIN